MSFPPPFTANKTIPPLRPRGHTMIGLPQKNLVYTEVGTLKEALKTALKEEQPALKIGEIFSQTDLNLFVQLENKKQPSNRDMQNFLRLPNKILRLESQAPYSTAIAKGFFQGILQAKPSELTAILPIFLKGFYGISSHPAKEDTDGAIQVVEQAEKAFFQHFNLYLPAFVSADATDILWKRLEEFIRITILPLSGERPKESAALAALDPATFGQSFAHHIGQEWAKDHSARFDKNRSQVWGTIASIIIKSCILGSVHQVHHNNGESEDVASICHFLLLPLLETRPLAACQLCQTLDIKAAITGKEKQLTRQQLLPVAPNLLTAIQKMVAAGDGYQTAGQLYQIIAPKLFISPSQAQSAASGFALGLTLCHD